MSHLCSSIIFGAITNIFFKTFISIVYQWSVVKHLVYTLTFYPKIFLFLCIISESFLRVRRGGLGFYTYTIQLSANENIIISFLTLSSYHHATGQRHIWASALFTTLLLGSHLPIWIATVSKYTHSVTIKDYLSLLLRILLYYYMSYNK